MKKLIPDCYWPSSKNGAYVSHEAICVLNVNRYPVRLSMCLYFEDRDKLDGFDVIVEAERTLHIRLDQLRNIQGKPIPMDTPYAILLESDQDVAVQYTRVDTTQAELAIATTMV